MRVLEDNFVNDNSPENINELSKCRAEFTRFLKIQESIQRQKAKARWPDDRKKVMQTRHIFIELLKKEEDSPSTRSWMNKGSG